MLKTKVTLKASGCSRRHIVGVSADISRASLMCTTELTGSLRGCPQPLGPQADGQLPPGTTRRPGPTRQQPVKVPRESKVTCPVLDLLSLTKAARRSRWTRGDERNRRISELCLRVTAPGSGIQRHELFRSQLFQTGFGMFLTSLFATSGHYKVMNSPATLRPGGDNATRGVAERSQDWHVTLSSGRL